MFDSKEIAKRARLRAESLRAHQKRRRGRGMAAVMLGLCMTALLIAAGILFAAPSADDTYIILEDGQIPLGLALFPDGHAMPYDGAVAENNLKFIMPARNVTVSAGFYEAEIRLINPGENTCWLTFEIILQETGETVYMSGMVGPSMCIEEIELTKCLERGEHRAALIIRAYEFGGLEPVNSASGEFVIKSV